MDLPGAAVDGGAGLRLREPAPHINRLAGSAWYKYRLGRYRVILDVKRKILIIYVIKVGPRKKIYKNPP